MLRSYSDIRTRLGEPLWFDDNGAPRYEQFDPMMCGVYEDMVALVEIKCQLCGEPFNVAVAWNRMDDYLLSGKLRQAPVPTKSGCWAFHYGDPPRHGCTGDTMNSEPVRVIEYWRKSKKTFDWVRVPKQEIVWPEEEES